MRATARDRVPGMRVGVLASGSGTILSALLQRQLPIVAVVVDRPCGALEIARNTASRPSSSSAPTSVPTFDRVAYTHDVVDVLNATTSISSPSPASARSCRSRSSTRTAAGPSTPIRRCCPSFKGWHAVRDALEFGVKVTGPTVHLVTEDVDSGPILAQEAVPVLDDDTEETLHERIKEVERRLYPDVIERLVKAKA